MGNPEREDPTPVQTSFLDSDRNIGRMHDTMQNKWKRAEFIQDDVNRSRNKFIRAIAKTPAENREYLQVKADEAIEKLKLLGLWRFFEKPDPLTFRQIQFIRSVLHRYKEPDVDLDSSEGITIYPNLESWYVDHYGSESIFSDTEER